MTASATTEERNKALVRRFIDEVANAHRMDLLAELCTSDHYLYHPAIPAPAHGTSEYVRVMGPIWQAWPDHHLEIEEIIAEGDRVGIRAIVTATNTGPMRGAKPTNKSTRSHVITTYRIRDGKISSTRVIEDIMKMLHDVGQVPRNLTALYWLKKLGVVRLLQKLGKIPGAESLDEFQRAEADARPSRKED